tara:strand:- start:255 stop:545 length:291 start_codon:yes stop_codon:yes gene_type:complete
MTSALRAEVVAFLQAAPLPTAGKRKAAPAVPDRPAPRPHDDEEKLASCLIDVDGQWQNTAAATPPLARIVERLHALQARCELDTRALVRACQAEAV